MSGKGHYYTEEQRAFLREAIPGHVWQETSRMFEDRFGFPLTRGQVLGARHRLGVRGAMRHRADAPPPANALPVGSERADDKGDLWVKVCESWRDNPDNEGLAESPRNGCWRRKSHIEWEKAHGRPVPEGCKVVFANRDHADLSPANLVAVPVPVLGAMTALRLDWYDATSLRACMAVAEIRMRLCARESERRSSRRPWTDEEDALVLAGGMPDRMLAAKIGRTAHAVKSRRCNLKRKERA